MTIEPHEYKDDRVIIDLNQNEFNLIAHLIDHEQQLIKQKRPTLWLVSISRKMHNTIQKFLNK